ncbi:MAG: PLP-dependent lyase/thiolase [Hyphomonadaceae bacterium]
MGEIVNAFLRLDAEGRADAFEKIIQRTTADPDVAAFLSTLWHLAAADKDGISGSTTGTDIAERLRALHGTLFDNVDGPPLPQWDAKTLTLFKQGRSPTPRWLQLPALFWIWLCEEHEAERFADSLIESFLRASGLCERLAKHLPMTGPPRSTNYAFFYGGYNDLEYTKEELDLIASRIRHQYGDDPRRPEYPMMNRRFPATPTHEISIDGRSILLKDESARGTGTHKERMAHEVIVEYAQKHIPNALRTTGPKYYLPRYSMISTGSAAVALQIQLDRYRLPNLHVVVDHKRTQEEVKEHLRRWGAVIFEVDLDEKPLSKDDVLALTFNEKNGLDLTIREFDEHSDRKFYDWLSYEILNLKPKHVFVPVGTGELFASLIYTMLNDDADPRSVVARPEGVTIWGAFTKKKDSAMTYLYAKHRPSLVGIEAAIATAIERGKIGERSKIVEVNNDFAQTAVQLIEDYSVGRRNFTSMFSIRTSPSGAAGLALFLQEANDIEDDGRIVVVNTGGLDLP